LVEIAKSLRGSLFLEGAWFRAFLDVICTCFLFNQDESGPISTLNLRDSCKAKFGLIPSFDFVSRIAKHMEANNTDDTKKLDALEKAKLIASVCQLKCIFVKAAPGTIGLKYLIYCIFLVILKKQNTINMIWFVFLNCYCKLQHHRDCDFFLLL
jgi:hypothetical protein